MTDAGDVARSRGAEGSAFIETNESDASDTRGLRWNLSAAESSRLGRLIVASLRNFAGLLDHGGEESGENGTENGGENGEDAAPEPTEPTEPTDAPDTADRDGPG